MHMSAQQPGHSSQPQPNPQPALYPTTASPGAAAQQLKTVPEQKLPLPCNVSTMQIWLKTTLFPFLQKYLPSRIRDTECTRLQKSLTIDRRARRWPPAPRGLLRLPGPLEPSGPGLWGHRSGTAVRGTGLAAGTTMTCSFPQGKIISSRKSQRNKEMHSKVTQGRLKIQV